LTTNYSSATVPVALVSGTIPVAVTNRLQPLLSGYTYHYRIVATNSFWHDLGSDLSFTGPVFGEIGAGLPGGSEVRSRGAITTTTATWTSFSRAEQRVARIFQKSIATMGTAPSPTAA